MGTFFLLASTGLANPAEYFGSFRHCVNPYSHKLGTLQKHRPNPKTEVAPGAQGAWSTP